jgi:hypothetical protein
MSVSGRSRRISLLAVVAALAVSAPAAAATTSSRRAGGAPAPAATSTTQSDFQAVTVVPGTSEAIAVGTRYAGPTMSPIAQRWSGTAWSSMTLPVGSGAGLSGVWAASGTDAWAVGSDAGRALVLHWNGHTWSVATVAGMPSGAYLSAISGLSGSDLWAVGSVSATTTSTPLELHYDGSAWKVLEQGPADAYLSSVALASAGRGWAVGGNASNGKAVVIQLTGSSWASQSAPVPSGGVLGSVSARGTSAWIVGDVYASGTDRMLTLRLSGATWVKAAAPTTTDKDPLLTSVADLDSTVWAAGWAQQGTSFVPLAERYRDGKWSAVAMPTSPEGGQVAALAAGSTSNVWAVGSYFTGKVCASNADLVAYHFTTGWRATRVVTPAVVFGAVQPQC